MDFKAKDATVVTYHKDELWIMLVERDIKNRVYKGGQDKLCFIC